MFEDVQLDGLPPYRIAQAGLGLVPEGRQIFPTLSVEENLIATAASRRGPPRWQLDDVYQMFPVLAERRRNMGNRTFRRRATNAGDRTQPDDQPKTSHPRRSNRGTGPAHPQRDLGKPQAAQGRRSSHSFGRQAHRRAAQARRPPRRDREEATLSGPALRLHWRATLPCASATCRSDRYCETTGCWVVCFQAATATINPARPQLFRSRPVLPARSIA